MNYITRQDERELWDSISDTFGHETIQGIVRQLDQDSRTGRIRTHQLPVPVVFDECVDLSLVVKAFVDGTPASFRGYWKRTREISNDGVTAEHTEQFLVYAVT